MKEQFNLVAIGGGAAGLVSAYIAAAVKAKVALIERDKMGGDCLNYGCVPSKALIRTARFVADMKRAKNLGVKNVTYDFNFPDVMDRVHAAIKKIEPNDSMERYEKLGVRCFTGHAEVVDPYTIKIGEQTLHTKNIVLALGAAPLIPPIEGLKDVPYRTSDNLWDMRQLPKRMIVLGGGPIGCEMAQAFARLGSQVTQIEMAPRLLMKEDPEVSQLITEKFMADGVRVLTDTQATRCHIVNQDKTLVCTTPSGSELAIPFDEILVAVGRKPRTDQLDAKALGITLNKNGTIQVDAYLRANGKNIYACGDVAGPYQFTHTAAHQAWYCAVNALFSPLKKFKVDYRVIPWVTFTDPEIAQVGYNETSAKAAGIPYETTLYDVGELDRAIAESEDHGLVKVLTVPGKDKILGATIVSHNAGEMITEFVTSMKYGLGLNKILGTIHSYPTFSEANKYAAGQWKKAHKPEGLLGLVESFHSWRRG